MVDYSKSGIIMDDEKAFVIPSLSQLLGLHDLATTDINEGINRLVDKLAAEWEVDASAINVGISKLTLNSLSRYGGTVRSRTSERTMRATFEVNEGNSVLIVCYL